MSTSSNGGRRRSPEAEEREKRYFPPVRGPKEEEPSGRVAGEVSSGIMESNGRDFSGGGLDGRSDGGD